MKAKEIFLGIGCLATIGVCLAGLKMLHEDETERLIAEATYQNERSVRTYNSLLVDYEELIAENNQLNILLFMADRSKGHVPMYELEEIYDKSYKAAEKYGLDGAMVLAVFGQESDYIKEATSCPWTGRKDRGLGQVSPGTLAAYNEANDTNYTEFDLYDIDIAADVSAWYLSDLQKRPYITNDLGVFTSYNRGPGNYKKDLTPNEYAYKVSNLQIKIENLVASL